MIHNACGFAILHSRRSRSGDPSRISEASDFHPQKSRSDRGTYSLITTMAEQYIYQIQDLRKFHDKKEVLKDIWLSFYPGAKSACSAATAPAKARCCGSWPATDKDFDGEAQLTSGFTVGYLPQEPQLNPDKTCSATSKKPSRPERALLARFDEISNRSAKPTDPDEMEKLLERAGQGAGPDRARQRLGARPRSSKSPMDAMNLPPGDADVTKRFPAANGGAWRCARCCCSSPTCCCSTSRRTISTPKRCLAGTASARLHGHRRRRDARSLLPRQRRPVDSGTRPRPGHSVRRATTRRGSSRSRHGCERKRRPQSARQKTLERELEWVRRLAAGPAGQEQGPHQAYEKLAAEQFEERDDETFEIANSAGPASGRPGRRGRQASAKAYGDNLLFENLSTSACRRRHRRHHRPQRRRQDDAVPHDHRPGNSPTAANSRVGDTVELGYVDQNRDASTPTTRSSRKSPAATTISKWAATRRSTRGPTVARFNFTRPRSAEKSRRSLRRRTQPRPSGQAAAPRRQRAAARRTDERPRRRYAAGTGRSDRSTSPAAPSSSATTAGSSTASPRTSSPSKATATSTGAKATSRPTKPSGTSAGSRRRSAAPDAV